jgi:hypothetical protein
MGFSEVHATGLELGHLALSCSEECCADSNPRDGLRVNAEMLMNLERFA